MRPLWALCVLAAACDPSVKASGQGAPLGDEQRSQLGESCASTLDCAGGLRCLDQVCRHATASTLGEFFAAAGARAFSDGDVAQAIEDYTQAVNEFEADKLDPPAEILCALGGALAADRGDRTHAEQAARMLHKCLLVAPPGTRMRALAMSQLALLREVGLDPLLLARTAPADAYLTKQGAAPSVDKLKVTAEPDGRASRHRSFTDWIAKLGSPEVKAAVAPCWEAHFKATREPLLTVQLGFKYSYRLDDYDDYDRATLDIDDVPAGGDANAVARACVRSALAPIADAHARATGGEIRWSSAVNVSIGE